jgi:hypothetical protein
MDIDENAPGNISQASVTNTTDNETGHDPHGNEPKAPLHADVEATIEEEISDVEAVNSVSSEHPKP